MSTVEGSTYADHNRDNLVSEVQSCRNLVFFLYGMLQTYCSFLYGLSRLKMSDVDRKISALAQTQDLHAIVQFQPLREPHILVTIHCHPLPLCTCHSCATIQLLLKARASMLELCAV